jgi:aerobic-type carbon monoxide dehydrogenase small subunit (CoxS/CutS family)
MIMSSFALLGKNPEPSQKEIVQAMDGNICRCGTYMRCAQAIRQAAEVMKGGGK